MSEIIDIKMKDKFELSKIIIEQNVEIFDLNQKNKQLQQRIDKTIEFIKNGIDFKSLHFIRGKDEDMWKIILIDNIKEELLEILGDKENE